MPYRLLATLLVLAAAGCGSSQTASLSGTVTLNGEPLAKGHISFTPDDDQGGTAGADVENGRYQIANLKPGTYHVQIVGVPSGPVIMPDSPEAKRKLTDAEIRAMINPLPGDVSGNNETVEVKAGAHTKDFHLESKNRP